MPPAPRSRVSVRRNIGVSLVVLGVLVTVKKIDVASAGEMWVPEILVPQFRKF